MEIMIEILSICKERANMSRIVYSANLNFTNVKPYIEFLLREGMLRMIDGPMVKYEITPKGTEAFEDLRKIQDELIQPLRCMIEAAC